MGFTYNDLQTRARSYAIAAATAVAGPCRVFSLGIASGADAADVQIYNAATAAGTDVIQLNALANRSNQFNWEPVGIRFDTGLSIAATGTPDSLVVTYMEE